MHIVMLPWLAFGHLLPFLELAKRFAHKGHRISFISTSKNIKLLPKLSSRFSSLITFVELSLGSIDRLPAEVESTIDLPAPAYHLLLHEAFDTLQQGIKAFVESNKPDWVLYDYSAPWAPKVAQEVGAGSVFVSLFNSATLGFLGVPGKTKPRSFKPEDYTAVPEWVPFPSTVAFRMHEVKAFFTPPVLPDGTKLKGYNRFPEAAKAGDIVAVRSSFELEKEWLELVKEMYDQPVVPLGLFPPTNYSDESSSLYSEEVTGMLEWLDKQEQGTVVYVAFGSEVKLTEQQVKQIALGLQSSRLPFILALRTPASYLPEDFKEQTEGQGVLITGWVPQVKILSHPSVGGFLTHAGFNSTVEGLRAGVVMATLPISFDQGLVTRLLNDKKMGIEIPRDEDDGSFTAESVANTLKLLMLDAEGKEFRAKAKENKLVFGNDQIHDKYISDFLDYLLEHRKH